MLALVLTPSSRPRPRFKIVAEGSAPRAYFDDVWNAFDFPVVAASWLALDVSFNVSVLRLVRLLRVFELVHGFPSLRKVVDALLSAFTSAGYVIAMWLDDKDDTFTGL